MTRLVTHSAGCLGGFYRKTKRTRMCGSRRKSSHHPTDQGPKEWKEKEMAQEQTFSLPPFLSFPISGSCFYLYHALLVMMDWDLYYHKWASCCLKPSTGIEVAELSIWEATLYRHRVPSWLPSLYVCHSSYWTVLWPHVAFSSFLALGTESAPHVW